jgi:hypothetical protein
MFINETSFYVQGIIENVEEKMTTYFAWVQETELFDPQNHARCDLEILKLSIDHREGEVALATVVIADMQDFGHHAFISCDGTLLFSGHLLSARGVPLAGDLVSLEFRAEPFDAMAQLQALKSTLKQSPY